MLNITVVYRFASKTDLSDNSLELRHFYKLTDKSDNIKEDDIKVLSLDTSLTASIWGNMFGNEEMFKDNDAIYEVGKSAEMKNLVGKLESVRIIVTDSSSVANISDFDFTDYETSEEKWNALVNSDIAIKDWIVKEVLK